MSKSKSSIGENIRKYRQQKGMSQDRLSKLANVAFHTIVKIESGETTNPTIETVKKIADALGVSLDDLMK
ncbi:MAG: helix-turn-helix transcriptional regulator [Candidatus Atribacteria bacterium]|nr:helix-turn-helix transcriptional regulator [Candidatus Atribacteria bacterium]